MTMACWSGDSSVIALNWASVTLRSKPRSSSRPAGGDRNPLGAAVTLVLGPPDQAMAHEMVNDPAGLRHGQAECELRDEANYIGSTINRAARLRDLAQRFLTDHGPSI
jgi:class 3 adenylate cyclase